MFHANLSLPQLAMLVKAHVLHPHGAQYVVCLQVATEKEKQAIDDLFSKTKVPALDWTTLRDFND